MCNLAKLNKLRHANVDLGIQCKLPAEFTGVTMFDNDGKWHGDCIKKFEDAKVDALLKKAENQAKEREQEAAQQRKRTRNQAFNQDLCIICQNNTNQQLHAVATLEWGQKFLKMAQEIGDQVLEVRLGNGDCVASEAKYHRECYVAYANKYRGEKRKEANTADEEKQLKEERVLLEIFEGMKEDAKNGEFTFTLAKLFEQFKERRTELGLEETTLRPTDLKDKIVAEFGDEITVTGKA